MFRRRKIKTDEEIAEELKEYDNYLKRLKNLTATAGIKIKEITLEVNKIVPFDDNHSLRLRKDGCIEVIEHTGCCSHIFYEILKMFKKRKSKADIELENALKNYEKYLEKLKEDNPSKTSEYEHYTAPLIFAIGNASTDIKNSINTRTLIMALCFIGLGIEMVLLWLGIVSAI